jgi:hypothetical protein
MFVPLLLISFSAVFALAEVQGNGKTTISVKTDPTTKKPVVTEGYDAKASATGSYTPNVNGSGWNYFEVTMGRQFNGFDDYFNSNFNLGYLEGYATCDTIYTFYPNFYSAVFGTSAPGNGTLQFLQDNYDWLNKMSNENYLMDDYWFNVKMILEQLNGMYSGYVDGCGATHSKQTLAAGTNTWATLDQPTLMHFLLINAWGDLYQITMKYREVGNPVRLALARLHKKKFEDQLKTFERCSAIIKVLPDKSDVVFGHATWDTFESLG